MPAMAWIETILPDNAQGLLARVYKATIARSGSVANVLRLQSLNPAVLQACIGLYLNIMHKPSPLSRARREMIATVVSRINNCHY